MPLSYDFKKMMRARAQADPKFRLALLRRALLRTYMNATVGFHDLERRTHTLAKSVMRKLGPKGSRSMQNRSNFLSALQSGEGVRFSVSTSKLG